MHLKRLWKVLEDLIHCFVCMMLLVVIHVVLLFDE